MKYYNIMNVYDILKLQEALTRTTYEKNERKNQKE